MRLTDTFFKQRVFLLILICPTLYVVGLSNRFVPQGYEEHH